jgi:hypothetical protein
MPFDLADVVSHPHTDSGWLPAVLTGSWVALIDREVDSVETDPTIGGVGKQESVGRQG